MLMSEIGEFLLPDVARLLRRAFDERARSIGVTRPQWRVLITLDRNESINQGGLADLLEVEPITLCRMVDRLQEAGLVERRPSPADRRVWQLFLTDKSRPLLKQLRGVATELLEEAMAGISQAEQVQLDATLERVRANLSRRTLAVANG
jgi:DNA-binding MarR family transcriptional regulator